MESGSAFAFLAADSFEEACKAFVRRVDAAGGAESLGWSAVEYMASEVGESCKLHLLFKKLCKPSATVDVAMYTGHKLTLQPHLQTDHSILRISKVITSQNESSENSSTVLHKCVGDYDECLQEDTIEDNDQVRHNRNRVHIIIS